MDKVKAFFGGLKDPTTSEFWLGWGGMVMKTLAFIPVTAPAVAWLDIVAGWFGFVNPMTGIGEGSILIATILSIALARMTSKLTHAKA